MVQPRSLQACQLRNAKIYFSKSFYQFVGASTFHKSPVQYVFIVELNFVNMRTPTKEHKTRTVKKRPIRRYPNHPITAKYGNTKKSTTKVSKRSDVTKLD